LSSHAQGEEGDQGTWIFHTTPLVGPMLTGGVASRLTPELFGPRNAGQAGVAACPPAAEVTISRQSNKWSFMVQPWINASTVVPELKLGNIKGIGPRHLCRFNVRMQMRIRIADVGLKVWASKRHK